MFLVREAACEKITFLEIHLFNSPDGGCSAYCRLLNLTTVPMHAGRFHFEREQNRVSEFLIEGYFLFENRTYGKSISSGKSLARLPVKTFHESLLAPEKLNLKVRTFKNIGTVYEFVQVKAWERNRR